MFPTYCAMHDGIGDFPLAFQKAYLSSIPHQWHPKIADGFIMFRVTSFQENLVLNKDTKRGEHSTTALVIFKSYFWKALDINSPGCYYNTKDKSQRKRISDPFWELTDPESGLWANCGSLTESQVHERLGSEDVIRVKAPLGFLKEALEFQFRLASKVCRILRCDRAKLKSILEQDIDDPMFFNIGSPPEFLVNYFGADGDYAQVHIT